MAGNVWNFYVLVLVAALTSKVFYISAQQRSANEKRGGSWYDKNKWSSSTRQHSPNSRLQNVEGSGGFESFGEGDLDPASSGAGPDDEDADESSGDGQEDDTIVGSGGHEPRGNVHWTYSTTSTSTRATTTTSTPRWVPPQTASTTIREPVVVPVVVRIETTPETTRRTTVTTQRIRAEIETHRPPAPPSSFDDDDDDDVDDESLAEVTTTQRAVVPTTIRSAASPATTVSDMYDKSDRRNGFDWILNPGVLTAVIGGAVVGLLAAILLVMFIVYRMRKKDEGSYALEEPKSPPTYSYAYHKAPTREFYA